MTYMFFLIHLETCGYFSISAYVGLGKDQWVYEGTGTALVVASLSSSSIHFIELRCFSVDCMHCSGFVNVGHRRHLFGFMPGCRKRRRNETRLCLIVVLF